MRVARASGARTVGAGWSQGRVGAMSGALVAGAIVFLAIVASEPVVLGGPEVLPAAIIGLPVLAVVTVLPGWVVGSRLGTTSRSSVIGIVAYAALAWTLWVPIGVVGSTWEGVQDGSFSNPVEVVLAMVFQLAYAALLSIFLWMVALVPGAVWVVAFRVLSRRSQAAQGCRGQGRNRCRDPR